MALLWEDAIGNTKTLKSTEVSGEHIIHHNIDNGPLGKLIALAPAVTAGAYVAGHCIGGKLTITGAVQLAAGTAWLQSLLVLDKANVKPVFDLFIFESDPTAATLTDHAAAVFSTNDVNVIAKVSVLGSDYVTQNVKAFAQLGNLGLLVQPASGTTLYAAAIAAAGFTFASTSDFKLRLGFQRD